MTSYLYYFFTFAFIGWMLEVAYSAVRRGRFVNRGFIFGPLCPIYGVCAMLLKLCLSPLADRWLWLFLAAVALATVVELVTGFLMDKIFSTKWWDYSSNRFNIGGYVCLRFSLYWGLLGTALVKLLFPVCDFVFHFVPLLAWQIVLWTGFAVFLVDLALSAASAFGLKVQLHLLQETRRALTKSSDTIGKGVYISTTKLELKYRLVAEKSARLYRRFLDAFPTMRTRDGVEIGVLRELRARGKIKIFGQKTQDETSTPESIVTPEGEGTMDAYESADSASEASLTDTTNASEYTRAHDEQTPNDGASENNSQQDIE